MLDDSLTPEPFERLLTALLELPPSQSAHESGDGAAQLVLEVIDSALHTHHHVKVDKKSGQRSEIAVMARFTLASGRILRCDELTHLLVGEREDRDLGSRG